MNITQQTLRPEHLEERCLPRIYKSETSFIQATLDLIIITNISVYSDKQMHTHSITKTRD